MRKIAAIFLIAILSFSMAGCQKEAEEPDGTESVSGTAAVENKQEEKEITAYRKYLEERENVSDLYFACISVSEDGQAVLAITHEKNVVDKESGYITASHIVLNNYVDGKVVQVRGSSMDSFSNTSKMSFADGKMWVPVYGGVGCYTVEGDTLKGNVYTTEMGASMMYSVKGRKRTEPEETEAATVDSMVKTEQETAVPIKFYKNTEENRKKYL